VTIAIATTVIVADAVNPIVSFTPVTATGGSGVLSYGVSPALPAGLNMDPATGTINGTATSSIGATAYTVTVVDSALATAHGDFSLKVWPQGFYIDTDQGLTWAKPDTTARNWSDASSGANVYCSGLTVNGEGGWRLPTGGAGSGPSTVGDGSELSALYLQKVAGTAPLGALGWPVTGTTPSPQYWSSTNTTGTSYVRVSLSSGTHSAQNGSTTNLNLAVCVK
jgi:hypothetical protein